MKTTSSYEKRIYDTTKVDGISLYLELWAAERGPALKAAPAQWQAPIVCLQRGVEPLGFDYEQGFIQRHPQAGLGAAHITGKFSRRKSLWKRVGVYSPASEAFQGRE